MNFVAGGLVTEGSGDPTGACTYLSRSGYYQCAIMTAAECDAKGGTYAGDNELCAKIEDELILTGTLPSSEVKCEGKTKDECCEDLNYCGCIGDFEGGPNPVACFCSPPPKGTC